MTEHHTLRALLTALEIAEMLHCSPRHVRRLCDAGRMPAPLRLGALVRWSRLEIERWIAEECPPTSAAPRRSGGRS